MEPDPHGPGCRAHPIVIDGDRLGGAGEEAERLGPGDVGRPAADRGHEIAAEGMAAARAILIVQGS